MYHTLSDYQDQNRNYSNQNKFNSNYNNTNIKNGNLNSMKKGTMVNGSEVYYGKGKKIDPIKSGNKINKKLIDITNGSPKKDKKIKKYRKK